MDKPGKTQSVSPTLPTGRRLPTSATATTSYELLSGKGEPISRPPALAYSPRKLSKRPGPSQWFVIPANHKWFRNLAISAIVADAMEEMGLKTPKPSVDLADIRRKYHAAESARATPRNHDRQAK
jgi:hypothetical protein